MHFPPTSTAHVAISPNEAATLQSRKVHAGLDATSIIWQSLQWKRSEQRGSPLTMACMPNLQMLSLLENLAAFGWTITTDTKDP